MIRSGWSVGVLLALVVGTANGAIGTWRNFTSMTEVRGVAFDGASVWAATSGGLFARHADGPAASQFTNAEGLRSMDLTAVAVDADGSVWTGASTGVIHVLSPSERTWRYILDISGSTQSDKHINRLVMRGDTVLVCSAFGLSMFFRSQFRFGDTYTRFGTILANTRVSAAAAAVHDGRLFAAIAGGASEHYVAAASLSASNLLPPEAWTLLPAGSPTNRVHALETFAGRLYAGTAAGLFVLTNDTVWTPVDSLAGVPVIAAAASPTLLFLSTAAGVVYTLNPGGTVMRLEATLPAPPTSVTTGPGGGPVVGSSGSGIFTYNGDWEAFAPNGPGSGQFLSLAVDPDGVLWAATGYNGNGKGIIRYDGATWNTFTAASHGLPTDDYYNVSVGCDGAVWVSSWARGVLMIPRGRSAVDTSLSFGANVGMVGLPNAPEFIVTSTVACTGADWMSVNSAADALLLAIRRSDGTWRRLPVRIGSVRITSLLDNIPIDRALAVDGSGTLWAVSRDRAFRGLFAFDNRGSIDDIPTRRDSVRYYLTENNGLPSNDVRTVVVDLDNDVWVGTDRGIAIILDPDRPDRSGSIAAYRPLSGRAITTIAVDPLNQKWVGTPEGAILLSPDGTQVLASYTRESTGGQLIDNDIKSIAIDGRTGTVYFGTLAGLASLTTAGAAPKSSFNGLSVYPNPFLLPASAPLTVDGLVANSALKVLTIDGRLVRALTTPGGRIGFWDGKDDNGNTVTTGVYLLVAYAEDGSSVATGKVAVIRR